MSIKPLELRPPIFSIIGNEQPQDRDFQTVHVVLAPMANIRSKPSIDGKIILGSESQLKGNLKSGTLIIEEGAKFAGTCDMAQYETDGADLDE